jgi:SNF2 family DNA or RNA helicase
VAEETWTTEADKWDHLRDLRISKVLGTEKQRLAALATPADIYVINRENVVWLVETLGKDWDFDGIVIDELSSFKSSRSKRWRALRRVIPSARYVYGLTGTPAPNGYIDLWPEIYLLDRGARLGKTLGQFRNTFFNPGAHKGHIVYDWRLKPGAKANIDNRLADLCLSMQAADWVTLPERTYNTVWVKLDRSERQQYDRLQRDKIIPLIQGKIATTDQDYDSAIVADQAAQLSGKLLQMANGAVYDENGDVVHIHDRKLDALEEIIEAAHGEPVLVFYNYRHDLARIKQRIPEAKTLFESDEMIAAWNRGDIPILLCHPASAGHGLNLQFGGHIIVWFGLNWSLELYQQANARLHRMGQERSVMIHHIAARDTLDERVMAALEGKGATQQGLLDALKSYIKEAQANV